jgi:ketosteroid isomerase-like protein
MKKIIVVFCCLLSFSAFAQKVSTDVQMVLQVLTAQQVAWNNGQLEAYMQGYWKSDSLTFIGKKGITKGWQSTLENYQKSYPDKSTMGQLSFEIVSLERLSSDAMYVIGKWNLEREMTKGNLSGHFTLVFKKIKGQWLIVSDHSS